MSEQARRRLSAAARRAQLIKVGRAVFAKRGYDATSIEEIAAAAKVSKPIVYEHFGGKEGLYAVIVDREIEYVVEQALRARGRSLHPSGLWPGGQVQVFVCL